jgi:hypothetical protein
MRIPQKHKSLKFGDFIMMVYDACGKRKAKQVVRLAVNTGMVGFQEGFHYVVS